MPSYWYRCHHYDQGVRHGPHADPVHRGRGRCAAGRSHAASHVDLRRRARCGRRAPRSPATRTLSRGAQGKGQGRLWPLSFGPRRCLRPTRQVLRRFHPRLTVFVDTSALFALLDADDAGHDLAFPAWSGGIDECARFVTTNYVIVETIALAQRRLDIHAVRTRRLSAQPILHLSLIHISEP